MFKAIHFKNFRVLKDATLPLERCTLLIGPNGSGKSTALLAIELLANPNLKNATQLRSATADESATAEVGFDWWDGGKQFEHKIIYGNRQTTQRIPDGATSVEFDRAVRTARVVQLEARGIQRPAQIQSNLEVPATGSGLAATLDRLRDTSPERWESLISELAQWFPEFDHILFDVAHNSNEKAFALRLAGGGNLKVRAEDLSQGVLLALAFLTMVHLPDRPSLLGIEEPERGVHPRLLRDIQAVLHRLSHPEEFGDQREPVQIIVTTHSPYLLDWYRDRLEQVVIAERIGDNVRFQRLSDHAHVREIIGEESLGEAWYTGVLGGVPAS